MQEFVRLAGGLCLLAFSIPVLARIVLAHDYSWTPLIVYSAMFGLGGATVLVTL